MKNLRWSFLFVLLFAVLSPSAHGGPFPWPWPWSYCQIRWQELEGRHNIVKDSEGETFIFQLSRASARSLVNVHIYRIDAKGMHSEGFKLVDKKEELYGLITIDMKPQAGTPYKLKFGMAFDKDRGARPEMGCSEPQKPQIMVIPEAGQTQERNYYVLDPALRF